ncbi:hypothetical protein [Flavobacterium sp.]|uniref:hypothetical protein n=1 Tax=Flavobacterium sp. TaxID=239 RepID=UPI0028BF2495|nr:hypothetical protein [Flavobacterium sp.]
MKKLFTLFAFLFVISAFSQKITMDKGKFFSNGKQLSTFETKKLLSSNYEASTLFKKGKTKEGVGGFLLGFGIAMVAGDAVVGLVSDVQYPSVMTYVGGASIITSIPVLSGRTKKIKKAIDVYNSSAENTLGFQNNTNVEMNVIANQNGYGLQIRF